jgi:hypothetical protein
VLIDVPPAASLSDLQNWIKYRPQSIANGVLEITVSAPENAGTFRRFID